MANSVLVDGGGGGVDGGGRGGNGNNGGGSIGGEMGGEGEDGEGGGLTLLLESERYMPRDALSEEYMHTLLLPNFGTNIHPLLLAG